MPKKHGYKKTQEQISLVAHDKILAFENFRYLLEGLEEYIEKSGYYPNFKNKRQLQNITVPKEKKYSLDNCENLFRTRLLLFVGILRDSEKIVNQTKEYLESKKKSDSVNSENMSDVINLFTSIQRPLESKREQAKLYEGKNYFGVEFKNKFKGDIQQGEQVFNQINSSISNNDFRFYEQNNPQQITNPQIIQDEEALIYHLVKLDPDGGVIGSLESQSVYPVSRFNQEELVEINRAKNISQTPIINQQLVNNIKQNTRLERNIVVFEPRSGSLIFNSDAMVRAKDLNEAEQREVGYRLETFHQVQNYDN
ncbi:17664_t:CDS:2 [Funneliformis geosporum]|nr:17664_t:CDS:2 [Funneliformis geosporum]